MKTFLDDIAILAVERCILKKIPELLTPKSIVSLNDGQISGIASETENSRNERTQSYRKLKVLTDAYRILQDLYRSATFGMCSADVSDAYDVLTMLCRWRTG